MAQITAALVKELREKSGAGMMDCKKALQEVDGNLEEAIDWLRLKGLATAAKKAGRVAAEGLIAISVDGNKAALIELNSETDFVAKNEDFQALARDIAGAAVAKGCTDCVDNLKEVDLNGKRITDCITDAIAKIGENLNLRRAASLEGEHISTYVHNATAANLGKIGVAVALSTTGDKSKLDLAGKQLAMHIAASKPESLTREGVDPKLVERERNLFVEASKASGKPDNIIEKMVEGKINKFYKEVVLPEQIFVIDGKSTINEFLAEQAKEVGGEIKITDYKYFVLGEGIEKKEENFAEEVAKVANS